MISEVRNIDCMEGMRMFPNKYFDLAICDPPYNIGADKPSIKPDSVRQKNGSVLKVKQANYQKKEWDSATPKADYFKELKRVSKNQIIWGVNYFDYPLPGGRIVWNKINGDSDQFGCEIAYCSFNNRTDIVHYMWSGMFQGVYCGTDIVKALVQQGNKALNEVRIHPTQKPVKIYKWLLRNFAKKDFKILDTHLGSGSSRIASYDGGFDFWGFENDKDYFTDQELRFKNHIAQLTIFNQ